MSIWNRKKYGISQRHRRQLSLQEAYHVKDPETNKHLLWIKRKRLGLKTGINVWESEKTEESNLALKIYDEAIFDVFGKFRLTDVKAGKDLAVFKRHFWRSLLREKWTIRNPQTNEEIVVAEARSLLISLIRNLRWLPILNYFDFFIQFIRLQWDFKDRKTGQKIGFFDRKFTIGDNYILDFSQDANNLLDSKTAVALGILLDTAEQR